MGALTKPIFAMAPTVGIVLTARLLDRVGKGVRGAPRDALVADTAPADLRGTAYGFFSLVSGVAMLLASVFAGLLWDRLGASFTFYAGAAFCVIALLGRSEEHTSELQSLMRI